MPNNRSKYVELWQRYLPAIIQNLSDSNSSKHLIVLSSYEFELIGNRKNYSFHLEYRDGKVSNNIQGSAVAKDLAQAIEDSAEARNILSSGSFKFTMDRNFSLFICRYESVHELTLDFN